MDPVINSNLLGKGKHFRIVKQIPQSVILKDNSFIVKETVQKIFQAANRCDVISQKKSSSVNLWMESIFISDLRVIFAFPFSILQY